MAIDTTVQPFIQRMLMPPDPRAGAEALTGAVNNFMGAYLARQDVERDEAEKMANDPNYVPQGGFQKFARGFLGAPGMVEEGKQTFSVQRRAGAEREVTLNRQIDSLLKDPRAIAEEIGNLTPDEIPEWVQRNGALNANPIGKMMIDGALKGYTETKQAQIKAAQAKDAAEAMLEGYDIANEADRVEWQKRKSYREAEALAQKRQQQLDPSLMPEGTIDPNTGRLNIELFEQGLKKMPRNESLQSQEERARLRNQLLQQRDFVNQQLRARQITIEEYKLRMREIDQQLRAYGLGVEIQNPPGFEPQPVQQGVPLETTINPAPTNAVSAAPTNAAPVRPTLKQVERPLTQGQSGVIRESISGLSDTVRRIEDVVPLADSVFGPKATFGEIVVDKALANLAPELADKKRIKGREAARYIKEGIMRSLNKGMGQLSDADVRRLESIYPALKGLDAIHESPENARQVLRTLQQQLSRDAYEKQRLLGTSQSPDVLRFLDPKFTLEELRAGRINDDDFVRSITQSPYQDEVKALRDALKKEKGVK